LAAEGVIVRRVIGDKKSQDLTTISWDYQRSTLLARGGVLRAFVDARDEEGRREGGKEGKPSFQVSISFRTCASRIANLSFGVTQFYNSCDGNTQILEIDGIELVLTC
jgi:hypothetical protein